MLLASNIRRLLFPLEVIFNLSRPFHDDGPMNSGSRSPLGQLELRCSLPDPTEWKFLAGDLVFHVGKKPSVQFTNIVQANSGRLARTFAAGYLTQKNDRRISIARYRMGWQNPVVIPQLSAKTASLDFVDELNQRYNREVRHVPVSS
jgi:hypothetical protein